MNIEPIVDLRDVTVSSRRNSEVIALEHVNWSVQPGEFWVVGGLHGTGKSDLMFMLAGLTKPLDGCYKLYGQDMGQHFGDEFLPNRLRVGMVFDDARLLSYLTLAENVALPARYHHNLHADESHGWVEALLKATDITEIAGSKPSMVGWPWRRRAALARALALKPEVLLLENPSRGLDWRQAAWWVSFVQKLWRGHDLMSGKPMAIVVSTDEFRPWRNSGAQFATLHQRQFEIAGKNAPEDDVPMARAMAAVGEGA